MQEWLNWPASVSYTHLDVYKRQTLNTGADSLAVRGDVSVAGLSYDKQRFGDVGLGVRLSLIHI